MTGELSWITSGSPDETRDRLEGETLKGFWFNRSQEYAAKKRGETFGRYEYAEEETVVFDPLPCWSHLPVDEQRRRVAALVQEIEEEARVRREAAGKKALGVSAILAQDPTCQALPLPHFQRLRVRLQKGEAHPPAVPGRNPRKKFERCRRVFPSI